MIDQYCNICEESLQEPYLMVKYGNNACSHLCMKCLDGKSQVELKSFMANYHEPEFSYFGPNADIVNKVLRFVNMTNDEIFKHLINNNTETIKYEYIYI